MHTDSIGSRSAGSLFIQCGTSQNVIVDGGIKSGMLSVPEGVVIRQTRVTANTQSLIFLSLWEPSYNSSASSLP